MSQYKAIVCAFLFASNGVIAPSTFPNGLQTSIDRLVSVSRLTMQRDQPRSSLDSELDKAIDDADRDDRIAHEGQPSAAAAPDFNQLKRRMAQAGEAAEDVRRRDAQSRMSGLSTFAVAQPGAPPRRGGCRTQYDLSRLRIQTYRDNNLESVARSLRTADLRQAVQQAKQGGYDKDGARRAALAQAQTSRSNAAQSAASAAALVSGPTGIERYRQTGLPADFQCGGAGSAAVCAYFIATWIAEVSEQTADGIECLW